MNPKNPANAPIDGAGDPPSPAPARALSVNKKRTAGKFSVLPRNLRLWVNQALRDGVSTTSIAKELAAKGCPDFTHHNVSYYYHGAYQVWLRSQERIENLQIRTEAALNFIRHFKETDKAAFATCNEILLASQVNDVLQDFDPERLKQLIDDKPEHYFKLAAAIHNQAGERVSREKLELELQKHRELVLEQKRKIEQAAGQTQAKGLTPEILAQIEEAARLL